MNRQELLASISQEEGLPTEELEQLLNEGRAVVFYNPAHHNLKPCAVGERLSTKINVNLGISPTCSNIEEELSKLTAALDAGADTVMDLSVGPDMEEVRKAIIEHSRVPVGTVPIYQAAYLAQRNGGIGCMTVDEIFNAIERHAQDGVDFVTVHTGITSKALEYVARDRLLGVVSRGGSILSAWMAYNKKENPLYENYDRLLELAKDYSLTLSLGDGLRPGCIHDGSDTAQFEELLTLGELTERARNAGVQVIVEGPGHLKLDQVEMNIRMQKQVCHGAPFYILGPLVTDIAPGYDHITSAIGGALAASCGADFLCVVTPAEHLGLPDRKDIVDGIMAARIAAHAADLVKNNRKAMEWDTSMAQARREINWEEQFRLALNPKLARKVYTAKNREMTEGCTMCGEMCAIKVYGQGRPCR